MLLRVFHILCFFFIVSFFCKIKLKSHFLLLFRVPGLYTVADHKLSPDTQLLK